MLPSQLVIYVDGVRLTRFVRVPIHFADVSTRATRFSSKPTERYRSLLVRVRLDDRRCGESKWELDGSVDSVTTGSVELIDRFVNAHLRIFGSIDKTSLQRRFSLLLKFAHESYWHFSPPERKKSIRL